MNDLISKPHMNVLLHRCSHVANAAERLYCYFSDRKVADRDGRLPEHPDKQGAGCWEPLAASEGRLIPGTDLQGTRGTACFPPAHEHFPTTRIIPNACVRRCFEKPHRQPHTKVSRTRSAANWESAGRKAPAHLLMHINGGCGTA